MTEIACCAAARARLVSDKVLLGSAAHLHKGGEMSEDFLDLKLCSVIRPTKKRGLGSQWVIMIGRGHFADRKLRLAAYRAMKAVIWEASALARIWEDEEL